MSRRFVFLNLLDISGKIQPVRYYRDKGSEMTFLLSPLFGMRSLGKFKVSGLYFFTLIGFLKTLCQYLNVINTEKFLFFSLVVK